MTQEVEYEFNETSNKIINKFVNELDSDKFIKYVEQVEYNIDVYSYITVALDTHAINGALVGFPKRGLIIEAIIELLGEEWNVYDGNQYTVIDAIDSLTYGENYTPFVYSYIDSYMEGVLSDKDYLAFLDRVAQYMKYGGRPPLKPERGLSSKFYRP